LKTANYDRICVVTGFKSELIDNFIAQRFSDVSTIFNENYETTGNLESLKKGLEQLDGLKQVTVLDADLIFEQRILSAINIEENQIITANVGNNHDPVYISVQENKIRFLSKKPEYSLQTTSEYVGIFNIVKNNIDLILNTRSTSNMDYEDFFHKNKTSFCQNDILNYIWYELDDELHLNTILSLPIDVKLKLFRDQY